MDVSEGQAVEAEIEAAHGALEADALEARVETAELVREAMKDTMQPVPVEVLVIPQTAAPHAPQPVAVVTQPAPAPVKVAAAPAPKAVVAPTPTPVPVVRVAEAAPVPTAPPVQAEPIQEAASEGKPTPEKAAAKEREPAQAAAPEKVRKGEQIHEVSTSAFKALKQKAEEKGRRSAMDEVTKALAAAGFTSLEEAFSAIRKAGLASAPVAAPPAALTPQTIQQQPPQQYQQPAPQQPVQYQLSPQQLQVQQQQEARLASLEARLLAQAAAPALAPVSTPTPAAAPALAPVVAEAPAPAPKVNTYAEAELRKATRERERLTAELAAEKARADQEVKRTKKMAKKMEAMEVDQELREVAISTGVKDVDYAMSLLQRELAAQTDEQLTTFDDKAYFNQLRETHGYLFGEKQELATTGNPQGYEPAAAPSVRQTQAQTANAARPANANQMPLNALQARLKELGLTAPTS
jgi:hypothetical protein